MGMHVSEYYQNKLHQTWKQSGTGFVVWNTVQAVSSYVRGVLSSHAVFKGVGVGSQAATALGAVFQFFVRDILGMAGGIVFAYAAGGNFDSNAKQWRLFADVMNDIAMALDLASPLIPGCFMLLASLGSVSRAMVGMAAGATHAALTQHFAAAGSNPADISAKAESRERASSIIGSLLGMAFTHKLADHVSAAWLFFVILTAIHVWANIRALRCLVLSSLNEPRLKLLLDNWETKEKMLTPHKVSQLESLLVPPLAAASEWITGRRRSSVAYGNRLMTVLGKCAAAGAGARGMQKRLSNSQVLELLCKQQQSAADKQYILAVTGSRRKSAGVSDQELVASSQQWVKDSLPQFLAALQQHAWELDKLYLPHPDWTAEW
eukprot:gene9237-9402_t